MNEILSQIQQTCRNELMKKLNHTNLLKTYSETLWRPKQKWSKPFRWNDRLSKTKSNQVIPPIYETKIADHICALPGLIEVTREVFSKKLSSRHEDKKAKLISKSILSSTARTGHFVPEKSFLLLTSDENSFKTINSGKRALKFRRKVV